jgi:DNA-binding transcriptional ArsR family regulator
MEKQITKRTLILNLLRERPRYGWEICQLVKTADYRRRISDLRERGFVIEAEREGRGRYLYKLVSEPKHVRATTPDGSLI